MLIRHPSNPLITPAQVRSSRPDFEVVGTFNAGVTRFGDETLMLVRVAERPAIRGDGIILCPLVDDTGEIIVKRIARDDPDFETSDPRIVRGRRNHETYLTSISHLRVARSKDGVQFTVGAVPWLVPETNVESFGVEDGRITCIGDRYYINYSAVSEHGIATSLVSTSDFVSFVRHGVIFPPSNRDVTLFPQQIDGLYVAYHRPMPGELGKYSIWMATSPDMVHWGGHRLVLQAGSDRWEAGRVGGGAPPLWTSRGWLSIYHAADRDNVYCLGAFLTPHDQPDRIIARSDTPIFKPEADYELNGFFGNVVFSCGALIDGDMLRLYYGAADDSMALAEAPLSAFLDSLTKVQSTHGAPPLRRFGIRY